MVYSSSHLLTQVFQEIYSISNEKFFSNFLKFYEESTHCVYLQSIVVVFVLCLLGSHGNSQRGDLQSQAGHALSLPDHGQNLGVKVHKQLPSLGVFDQE